ncbi:MAG: type IV secretion system protein [Pedococcus sp.]
MSCPGVLALNPMCLAGQAVQSATTGAVDSAFSRMSGYFGLAATNATTWLWKEIDSATSLDLTSPRLAKEMAATAAVAGVLCLGLFVIQLIASVLRREPAALARGLQGLLVSFVGSALALAATRALLGAVDSLSAGLVQYTMGTNISGLGNKLAFAGLANVQNPAVTLIFSVVILAAVVVVWGAMMIRKVMLLIAAVLAPLAFAGATADITRGWVRKWIEFVCAMIVSKLLLVIILSIGIAVFNGAGQDGGGVTQTTTQLAGGALILLMGGFAPWVAIKMFSFAGDTLYAAHATAGQASAGARTVISAPQKVTALQYQARALMPSSTSRSASGPTWSKDREAGLVNTSRPAAPAPTATPAAGGRGAAGAAAGSGGAAAISEAAAPAVVAATAAQAVKSAGQRSIGAVETAAGSADQATVGRSDPPVQKQPPKSP